MNRTEKKIHKHFGRHLHIHEVGTDRSTRQLERGRECSARNRTKPRPPSYGLQDTSPSPGPSPSLDQVSTLVLIIQLIKLAQQNIIRRRAPCIPHPLRLDPEENPYPPSNHLHEHEHKHAALQIVDPVDPHGQPADPCEAEDEVDRDRRVVDLVCVKVAVRAEAERVVLV